MRLEHSNRKAKLKVLANPSGERFDGPRDLTIRLVLRMFEEGEDGQGVVTRDPQIERALEAIGRGDVLFDAHSGRQLWPPKGGG